MENPVRGTQDIGVAYSGHLWADISWAIPASYDFNPSAVTAGIPGGPQ